MRVPMIETDGVRGPDLPDGFVGTATLTADGDYLLAPANVAEQVAELASRVDAAAALADKANATAQEVAGAMRPGQ